MTLDDAIKHLEAQFSRIETTTLYADDIHVFACGGVKPEGELHPAFCASREVAARLWLDGVLRYKAENPGDTLVWRAKPEFDEILMHRTVEGDKQLTPVTLFKVYSRLAIRNSAPVAIDYLAATRAVSGG